MILGKSVKFHRTIKMPQRMHSFSESPHRRIQIRMYGYQSLYTNSKIVVLSDDLEPTSEDIKYFSLCLAAMLSRGPPEGTNEGVLQEVVNKFNFILDMFSKKMAVGEQMAAALERSSCLRVRAAALEKNDQAAGETDVQVLF